LGQTICDKTEVLLGTYRGTNLRTLWEQRKKKIPCLPPSERKKLIVCEYMLSLFHWLHEISLSKTVGHHFSHRLMARAEFGDIVGWSCGLSFLWSNHGSPISSATWPEPFCWQDIVFKFIIEYSNLRNFGP
jgi:hypothetical protein